MTVALSGDGGDEVFGGYNRYVAGTRLWRRLGRRPAAGPARAGRASEAVPPRIWDGVGTLADRALPEQASSDDQGQPRAQARDGARPGGRRRDVRPSRLHVAATRAAWCWAARSRTCHGWPQATSFGQPADRMMLLDLLGYLPDDILAKVDRASMGTSLEVRAPFLDHRLVEFAWRLPLHQKIRGGEGKWLVRRVLERHVPRSLFERPKHGFGVPIDAWLRGPLRGWAQDLLSQQRLEREGFLDPAPIQAALREHLDGRRNHQYQLWAVLMFQSWLEETTRRQALRESRGRRRACGIAPHLSRRDAPIDGGQRARRACDRTRGRRNASAPRSGAMGVEYATVPLQRTSMNPVRDAGDRRCRSSRTFRRFRADAVLVYAAKPVIYGSIAARLASVPLRAALITGVGSALGGGSGTAAASLVGAHATALRVALASASTSSSSRTRMTKHSSARSASLGRATGWSGSMALAST